MRLAAIVLAGVMGLAAAAWADNAIRVVEKLPRTEELESGQLTLQRISDRQLVALMLDLVKRVEFDRSQHEGKAGPDGAYLKGWMDKVVAEMDGRKMSADVEGVIDVPPEK